MNWNSILLYTLFSLGTSSILAKICGGGLPMAFLFVIIMGAGYSYGTFQMMFFYKNKIKKFLEELKK